MSPSAALSSPRQRCATARSHGHRAPALELVEELARRRRLAERDRRLDRLRVHRHHSQLAHARAHEAEDGLECGPCLRMAAERELEDAERPAVLGLREAVFGALGDRETLVEGDASRLRAAELGERKPSANSSTDRSVTWPGLL